VYTGLNSIKKPGKNEREKVDYILQKGITAFTCVIIQLTEEQRAAKKHEEED
jgi:hypothetical protein